MNRELSEGLARARPEWNIFCFVERATVEEISAANEKSVKLIPTDDNHLGAFVKVKSIRPDAIIGHSHISGGAANYLAAASETRWVQFVHHDPEDTETFKEYRVQRVLERENRSKREVQFAIDADAVVCIGPRLFREFDHKISASTGSRTSQMLQIDCGFRQRPRGYIPNSLEILSLGRSDSLRVKGLDVVAMAAGLLNGKIADADRTVRFRIRGAKGDADALEAELVAKANEAYPSSKVKLNVLPYSTDAGTLRTDLNRSQLFLMPSRAEGFGLVAMEALSGGTPVFVSRESGVGELIEAACTDIGIPSDRFVVPMDSNDRECAETWAEKIAEFWRNKEQFHRETGLLQDWLAEHSSWKTASESLAEFLQSKVIETPAIDATVPTIPHDPKSGALIDIPFDYIVERKPEDVSGFLLRTIAFENYSEGRKNADRGDWQKSYYYHLRAFGVWQALEEKDQCARSLGRLGWVHLALGNSGKALEFLNRSVEIDALQGAGNLFWAAQYAFRTSDEELAETALERFVQVCLENDIVRPTPEDLSSPESAQHFIERFYRELIERQRTRQPSATPWSDIGRHELIRANIERDPSQSREALISAIEAFDVCGLASYSSFCRSKISMLDAYQCASDPKRALEKLGEARLHLQSVTQKFGQQTEVLLCYEYSMDIIESWFQTKVDPAASRKPLEVVKRKEQVKLLERPEYQQALRGIVEALGPDGAAKSSVPVAEAIMQFQRLLPDLEGFYWPVLGGLLLKELTLRRKQ